VSVEGTDRSALPHVRALAFLGDAVYEIFLRRLAVESGSAQSAVLHSHTTQWANAAMQACLLEQLTPHLYELETEIVRRARNMPVNPSRKKNQTQHRQATAFEALLGALYLTNPQRLQDVEVLLLQLMREQTPLSQAGEKPDNPVFEGSGI
jgi:ribonuclease III family protein